MTLSLTCRSCRQEITGEDEDGLVAAARAHHDTAHGSGAGRHGGHGSGHGPGSPTREQVLARLDLHRRRHGGTDHDTSAGGPAVEGPGPGSGADDRAADAPADPDA